MPQILPQSVRIRISCIGYFRNCQSRLTETYHSCARRQDHKRMRNYLDYYGNTCNACYFVFLNSMFWKRPFPCIGCWDENTCAEAWKDSPRHPVIRPQGQLRDDGNIPFFSEFWGKLSHRVSSSFWSVKTIETFRMATRQAIWVVSAMGMPEICIILACYQTALACYQTAPGTCHCQNPS